VNFAAVGLKRFPYPWSNDVMPYEYSGSKVRNPHALEAQQSHTIVVAPNLRFKRWERLKSDASEHPPASDDRQRHSDEPRGAPPTTPLAQQPPTDSQFADAEWDKCQSLFTRRVYGNEKYSTNPSV
jgi:hypothetical protein